MFCVGLISTIAEHVLRITMLKNSATQALYNSIIILNAESQRRLEALPLLYKILHKKDED